jgi:hypothetical protein
MSRAKRNSRGKSLKAATAPWKTKNHSSRTVYTPMQKSNDQECNNADSRRTMRKEQKNVNPQSATTRNIAGITVECGA